MKDEHGLKRAADCATRARTAPAGNYPNAAPPKGPAPEKWKNNGINAPKGAI